MITLGQIKGAQLENVAAADTITVKPSGSIFYDTEGDKALLFDFDGKGAHINTTTLVGSGTDKGRGLVQYDNTELQAAIDALELVGNGGTITLMPGTYTGPFTISQKIKLIGTDETTIISGDVTYAAGSNFSSVTGVRFQGNVTVADTVTHVSIMECFMDDTYDVTDNNPTSDCNIYLLMRL